MNGFCAKIVKESIERIFSFIERIIFLLLFNMLHMFTGAKNAIFHASALEKSSVCLPYCHAKALKWEKSLKIVLYLCLSINYSVLTRTHKHIGSDNFRKCNLHLHFHKCQLFLVS